MEPRDIAIHNDLRQLLKNAAFFRATRAMFQSPHAGVFDSTLALMAHHEWVSIMMFVPAIFTFWYHPESLSSNDLLDRLGYNDACVLFDTTPARYVAGCIFPIVCYFCIMHVHFKLARVYRSDAEHLLRLNTLGRAYIYCTNIGFAFAQCFFVVCFLIPPSQSVYWHTIPFIVNMIFRWLASTASFVEFNSRIVSVTAGFKPPLPQYAYHFFALQGFVTMVLPVCWMVNYNAYDRACGYQGSDDEVAAEDCGFSPPVPAWFVGACDYIWFICLPLTPIYLPHNPVPVAHVIELLSRVDADDVEQARTGVTGLQRTSVVARHREMVARQMNVTGAEGGADDRGGASKETPKAE